ncbi:phage shock protein PspC (stress-responsive transcriptional regulator) [Sedimentibacter acidaminivorans]|uniref:Phage shock protein PspC (Stress-responsive transcriptional regulator) n=1 Tax=Sedimentibacter acidaminivorans TaxID=913099 RepID=A0ABS4GD84_9FIRM|nr:PspC domain-containing protein [Sedimentibacter acidaminivorans]MBP1925648.1 phage shock protein PspC (stress-responsive transcriptional regulator) [Sedimentibacter acidaminivorans]
MKNKLRKSSTDKVISGVCGGIADYFDISSLGIRLIFIILPANLLIYIILANIMHDSPSTL